MKKKTISYVADTVFWYLLYFFPVIAYLLFLIAEPSSGTAVINLYEFFNSLGINFLGTGNVFLSALNQMFGVTGILPLFNSELPFYFFVWFASTYLIHLVIDFLLFIPRLAHKWMNYFTKE